MAEKLSMRDKTIRIILVAIAITVAWLLLSPQGAKTAPMLTMTTLQGKKINLQSPSRPTLVVFWATTCGTCIKEVPHLKKLYAKLHAAGFEMVGVAMYYDRPDLVIKMAKRLNLNYPVVYDFQKKIFKAFKLERPITPRSILIGPNNRIVMHTIGPLNMAKLEKTINGMLSIMSLAK